MGTRNQKKNLGPNIQYTDSEKTDINILLLGETGVGKSTFVNSFVNYLQYTDFKTAESSEITALIPSKFTIPDENFVERIVEIGSDKNELNETGESATQRTKAYVFPIKDENRKIRIIDTPGIGDTKGLEQDKINFENILSYISQFSYLHAICFLFKPNVSRINAYFKYCLQHLLCHLEKSANRNIVFVFTNSRSTFYRPGETLSNLKKILKDVEDQPPNVKIPLSKENMFCFDNEAFKFLVALKNNIKFSEQEKKDYASSWDTSVSACWSMLGYIVGNGTLPGLKPHLVQSTISINEARRLIINLSKPLADISDLSNDNITVLNRHRQRISQENISKEELIKCLYVPTVNLKDTELQHPVTVCTHVNCCDIYPVAGKNKYYYKQKCHNPCYLKNIPKEIVGSPALSSCAAMEGNKCKVCGCDFSVHMHIYYESTVFEDKMVNDGVKKQLKTADDVIAMQFKWINDLTARQKEYDLEKKIISKSTAKFAHFLKENSITPYNDAFSDYIRYLIDRENGLGSQRDQGVIRQYEDVLSQHEQEKNILDEALIKSKKVDPKSAIITANDVFVSVKSLFNLPHAGSYIKNLHEQQEKLRRKEHEDFTEYFHFTEIQKPKQKKKGKNKNKNKSRNAREAGSKSEDTSQNIQGPPRQLAKDSNFRPVGNTQHMNPTKNQPNPYQAPFSRNSNYDMGPQHERGNNFNYHSQNTTQNHMNPNYGNQGDGAGTNSNPNVKSRTYHSQSYVGCYVGSMLYGIGQSNYGSQGEGNNNTNYGNGYQNQTRNNDQPLRLRDGAGNNSNPNVNYQSRSYNNDNEPNQSRNRRNTNTNQSNYGNEAVGSNNTNYGNDKQPLGNNASGNNSNPNVNYQSRSYNNDNEPNQSRNRRNTNTNQSNYGNEAVGSNNTNYGNDKQPLGNNASGNNSNPNVNYQSRSYNNDNEPNQSRNRRNTNTNQSNYGNEAVGSNNTNYGNDEQPLGNNASGNNSNPNVNSRRSSQYQSYKPNQSRNSQLSQGSTNQTNFNQRRGQYNPRYRNESRNGGHLDIYNNLDLDEVKGNLLKDIK